MLKHIPVITYACGYILEDWKYFSRDHDSVSLYRREIAACLKDYFTQIYRLEKHSQSCPNMPQNWRRGFSAIARLCQTCTIVTSSNVGWLLCGWEINLLVMLYVQFPENPLRKYISTQDIPDRKKKPNYFTFGFSVGAAGLLSSQTFPLLAVCTVGCSPAPCAWSSSWNTAFGFSVSRERPVMI